MCVLADSGQVLLQPNSKPGQGRQDGQNGEDGKDDQDDQDKTSMKIRQGNLLLALTS